METFTVFSRSDIIANDDGGHRIALHEMTGT